MSSDPQLRIGFIGAGGVNFGGAEGPWDHASRLERIGGLKVAAIADPDIERANRALEARRGGAEPGMYADARVFADFHEMLGEAALDAVFIGLPPNAHARAEPPQDAEMACVRAGVHCFLEKPLAAWPPEELTPVAEAMAEAARRGLIVSVGYMFRYSRAVARMRELLDQTPGGLRAVTARYNCAYSNIAKREWWDIRQSGGPIVEQATHFCDLARYLGGEIDLASVQATAITPGSDKAALCDVPRDAHGRRPDDGVEPTWHVPRATAASWRFASGAIGSLAHATLLHGQKYDSQFEVWADGLRMVLDDPYGASRLLVRRPHEENTAEDSAYADDDTYLSEDAAFIEAIRNSDASLIRSPYADALKTHAFTWAIRRASER